MLCARTLLDPRHHATGTMTEFGCFALSLNVPGVKNVLGKPVCGVTHDLDPDSLRPDFADLNRNLIRARRGVAVAGRDLHSHSSTPLAHANTERPGVETFDNRISASTGDMAQ